MWWSEKPNTATLLAGILNGICCRNYVFVCDDLNNAGGGGSDAAAAAGGTSCDPPAIQILFLFIIFLSCCCFIYVVCTYVCSFHLFIYFNFNLIYYSVLFFWLSKHFPHFLNSLPACCLLPFYHPVWPVVLIFICLVCPPFVLRNSKMCLFVCAHVYVESATRIFIMDKWRLKHWICTHIFKGLIRRVLSLKSKFYTLMETYFPSFRNAYAHTINRHTQTLSNIHRL